MFEEEKANQNSEPVNSSSIGCIGCGATLTYKPGTRALNCSNCGSENLIPEIQEEIKEKSFEEYLQKQRQQGDNQLEELNVVKCQGCNAETTLGQNIKSKTCPYCDTPLIIETAHCEMVIRPKSLLPFEIDEKKAKEFFRNWMSKLWFLPSELKNILPIRTN
jgi:LSD1 subclass zinc finger protein